MEWFYRITFFLSKILSKKVAVFFTVKIAEIMYFTLYSKKKVVIISNLNMVYKNLPKADAKKMVMEIYINFAKFIYEFLIISKVNLSEYVKASHKEYIDEARKKRNGVIILTGHIGNWELGAAKLNALGYSTTLLSLPQASKYTKNFFTMQRRSFGVKIVYLGESLKSIVSALKRNELIATPGDHLYSGDSTSINFFGKPASLPTGIFEIASRTQTPIVPAFCVKEGNQYTVYFEPPLKNGIQEWVKILEYYVKKYTNQWFTFDKIWN